MRLIDANALLETLDGNDINGSFDADFIKDLVTRFPTVKRERFVVRREYSDMTLYAYAYNYGQFTWGVLCEAVKFDTKIEAEALIATMALADDKSVTVEKVEVK